MELLGSDATGANVFFATTDQLTSQDTDTQRDYYDAHICTVSDPRIPPTAEPPPPCGERSCRTPSATPSAPAAASVTLNGQGNLSPTTPSPGPTVRALGHTGHGAKFLLRLNISARGRVVITGASVRKASRNITAAGNYAVKVTLTPHAARALQRKHKLKLKLHIAYTPTTGAATALNVTLTNKS